MPIDHLKYKTACCRRRRDDCRLRSPRLQRYAAAEFALDSQLAGADRPIMTDSILARSKYTTAQPAFLRHRLAASLSDRAWLRPSCPQSTTVVADQ